MVKQSEYTIAKETKKINERFLKRNRRRGSRVRGGLKPLSTLC